MDEIVELVVKKTGISEDQAQIAVNTVIGFLKDKLPETAAGQLDGLLGGQGAQGSMDDIVKGLGGFLGKK